MSEFGKACAYALAEILVSRMVFDEELDMYILPEENSIISADTTVVENAKKVLLIDKP